MATQRAVDEAAIRQRIDRLVEVIRAIFAVYQHPLGYEIRDLTITVGDDVAFGHSLNRISGTLKNGTGSGFWVRWTPCLRKIHGNWLIVHHQASVPFDVESGRAALNLEP